MLSNSLIGDLLLNIRVSIEGQLMFNGRQYPSSTPSVCPYSIHQFDAKRLPLHCKAYEVFNNLSNIREVHNDSVCFPTPAVVQRVLGFKLFGFQPLYMMLDGSSSLNHRV